jgi:dTDP-4-amino-4,6-dideoxygalactose transaminase
MDVNRLENLITEKTAAILCVHQVGMPCDLETLLAIRQKYKLPLVEDAACATGSEVRVNGKWDKIGAPHSDVAVFSFHPRKVITTGDGGMITTSNPEIDEKCKLWRQHSMSVRDTVRHNSTQVIFEEYTELGYNYRMTDIQAAVGRVQLKRLPQIIERRRELADRYHELLGTIPGLVLPYEPDYARSNWQSYIVCLPERLNQMKVMQQLLDEGISTRRAVMNVHREPAYQIEAWRCGNPACDHSNGTCSQLANSEYIQDHAIAIPLYVQMSDAEQDYVVDALRRACIP